MRFSYTINSNAISIFYNHRMHAVRSNSAGYAELKEHLKLPNHDPAVIERIVDRPTQLARLTSGMVSVVGSTVYFKQNPVRDALAEKLVQLLDEGFDATPWAKFMERISENPSERSRECLFAFLEKHGAPITEDGHFLAFKRVRSDFKDIHSGKFDNSVGQTVEIDRSKVDDDPERTCSHGLHVAASSYLDNYASASKNKTIVVKVDPADVVAVPSDYNHAKMRVCKYVVTGEAEEWQYNEFGNIAVANDAGNKVAPEPAVAVSATSKRDASGRFVKSVAAPVVASTASFTRNGKTYTDVEILAGIKKAGSQREFSRQSGIPRSTLQGWVSVIDA